MSSVADEYLGRTIDILAFPGAQPSGDTLLTQALMLPGQGGEICTGIQKLAQRFLLELLTPVGSLIYMPTRGTNFVPQLMQGLLQTPTAVMIALSGACLTCQINLQAEETGLEPPDEQFLDAVVQSVAVSTDTVTTYIQVNSRAGTSRVAILPLASILGGGP